MNATEYLLAEISSTWGAISLTATVLLVAISVVITVKFRDLDALTERTGGAQ
jgi:hypothetical protein